MLKFFTQFPELIAVMSEKEDDSMKLFSDGALMWENQKNRKTFFEKIGIDGEKVIIANLVHGKNVAVVENAGTKIILKTDALVTKEKHLFLALTIADCIPVFFYEKEKGIAALAHAGWRGIVGGILQKTVDNMIELGGKADRLCIAFGPGINVCHFEIKEDVLGMFVGYDEFIIRRDGKMFVDLKGIIRKKLADLGIEKFNIESDETCTFEAENLFSFRRDKNANRMIALIGIK